MSLASTMPSRASESPAGLLACRDIANASARLACFDREAAALGPSPKATGAAQSAAATRAAAPTATAPTAATSAAAVPAHPAPVLDPQQQFGLPEHAVAAKEIAAGTRAADASKIEANIVRVAREADGRMVFTLDNDQVWRQLIAEGDLLAKPGDAVTISRGWLGSYWLQLKSKRGCKITRLR
jgi:hypothetical protein